jgi:sulfate permease, SulP family
LKRALPFLDWLKDVNAATLRMDCIAGLTVALILIPQSMAYAQLAGMPVQYGLYASLLPTLLAALFGSSRQLATGPVAIVSLMTFATLQPMATAGSEAFISYAILLALVVGFFQFMLGALRLGLVINFLSHPVVNGFTNAGAIIIATSQLSKIFGVHVDSAEHHYETVIQTIQSAIAYTHWPTVGLGILAFVTMYGLRRLDKRIPYVLIAVVLTTIISWATGYEHNQKFSLKAFISPEVQEQIKEFNAAIAKTTQLAAARTKLTQQINQAEEISRVHSTQTINLKHQALLVDLEMTGLGERSKELRTALRALLLTGVQGPDQKLLLYLRDQVPAGLHSDGRRWRIRASTKILDEAAIPMAGGGDVVGNIPKGLPPLSIPHVDFKMVPRLFSIAAIISLLAFMEAISIAKAMAAKTGQRLDPNQELIGQGLGNLVGALTQSFPVSGSFSRSAVNIQSGAVTGLSSAFTALSVAVVLLFLTPLLYYLPQSVLAAVIMMAVIGLINVSGFVHAWKAQKYDGLFAVITFVATLITAPHLDIGIMIGVLLSLGMFLYKSMRPRVVVLSKYSDSSFRSAQDLGLRECRHIAMIRFDGPLFYANAGYLEEQISERTGAMQDLRHILIVANGINDMDASGEEMLSLIVDRVRSAGYDISFSGINENVYAVMKRTHLYEKIGRENVFPTMQKAVEEIHARSHTGCGEECPLLSVCFI